MYNACITHMMIFCISKKTLSNQVSFLTNKHLQSLLKYSLQWRHIYIHILYVYQGSVLLLYMIILCAL